MCGCARRGHGFRVRVSPRGNSASTASRTRSCPDSAAAHLLGRGEVDVVIVGTDRTTAGGDVANKVGTYPLALAARDNGVPFYVAVPTTSIDWSIEDGADIPIEERDADEVTRVWGVDGDGVERWVRVVPEGTRAANYAFDVTPGGW